MAKFDRAFDDNRNFVVYLQAHPWSTAEEIAIKTEPAWNTDGLPDEKAHKRTTAFRNSYRYIGETKHGSGFVTSRKTERGTEYALSAYGKAHFSGFLEAEDAQTQYNLFRAPGRDRAQVVKTVVKTIEVTKIAPVRASRAGWILEKDLSESDREIIRQGRALYTSAPKTVRDSLQRVQNIIQDLDESGYITRAQIKLIQGKLKTGRWMKQGVG
jgi:hypothetical protein